MTLATMPGEHVSETVIRYLNRLGDFLFVAARAANAHSGVGDVAWNRTRGDSREGPVEPTAERAQCHRRTAWAPPRTVGDAPR